MTVLQEPTSPRTRHAIQLYDEGFTTAQIVRKSGVQHSQLKELIRRWRPDGPRHLVGAVPSGWSVIEPNTHSDVEIVVSFDLRAGAVRLNQAAVAALGRPVSVLILENPEMPGAFAMAPAPPGDRRGRKITDCRIHAKQLRRTLACTDATGTVRLAVEAPRPGFLVCRRRDPSA